MKTLACSLTLVAATATLAGCSDLETRPPEVSAVCEPTTTNRDLQEILAFGAQMAAANAGKREETCRTLLQTQKNGKWEQAALLRLIQGRLLSDACGNIGKLLEAAAAAQMEPELQNWFKVQIEALKRINNTSKKLTIQTRKLKSSEANQQPKDDENRLLREKLDAIRSIETQIDGNAAGQ
jgi:hypothetical protein